MSEKKLFLLDAYALIYRAHFAFIRNPRITSTGLNTSAIFGFTTALLDVLENHKPTHIAVCFDLPGKGVRDELFPAYKANREETPDDIRLAVPYIYKMLEAFNIPAIGMAGYEADDVIGTLSKKAEKQGFKTYMMTPDKDYAQLVSENIFMLKPAKGGDPAEVLGVKEVCEKFEVERPEQVIDILGLWGDAVDNIPGIPGIGEKTAKALIKQYGSVENLIAHADELKGKQKENVINFAEQGMLSKLLATIILDAPIELDEVALIKEDPNENKIQELFSELEFRTLLKRVLKNSTISTESEPINAAAPTQIKSSKSASIEGQMSLFGEENASVTTGVQDEKTFVSPFTTLENTEKKYTLIKSIADLELLANKLSTQKDFCFDTETSSLDELTTTLLGISISYKLGEAYYIAIPIEKKEREEFKALLNKLFSDTKQLKIAHNVKFDLSVLLTEGIEVKGLKFDTMIAHYLLEPDQRHNMDYLSETYLQYTPVSIESLIGKKGKGQQSMADLTPEEVSDYACEDADVTYQLYLIFKEKINHSHLKELFYDIEMPLTEVLMQMEREGISIDEKALQDFSELLNNELIILQDTIFKEAEMEFNIDSPKQMGEVLFEKLKIDSKAKKTKTGQYKTDEQTLSALEGKHPIIDSILEYRQLRKLKSTYVDALPKLISPLTNRIHTTFAQTVAATGRLSSNNPNLQNIPIRSTKGKEIRKAFRAKDANHKLLAADYSQIELRIIAALSKDQGMIDAFNRGIDIHAATASKVFDVPLEEVTKDMRSKAKMVNFGIIYGISAFGLSQRLGVSRTEAKEIIDNYFEKYGRIKAYMDECIEFARQNGYVETIMKRRRYLPKINEGNGFERGFAERNAINAPIQGSAADIIKVAMINIQKRLLKEQLKSKLILQVHDELLLEVPLNEETYIKELVKFEMENAVKLNVPMEVEVGFASNWLDAH
jgi:DNA polymerase-1